MACSHGDVIKAIVADALGVHLDLFQRIVADPASVTVIRYTALRPFLVRLNDTGGDLAALVPPPAKRRRRAARWPTRTRPSAGRGRPVEPGTPATGCADAGRYAGQSRTPSADSGRCLARRSTRRIGSWV